MRLICIWLNYYAAPLICDGMLVVRDWSYECLKSSGCKTDLEDGTANQKPRPTLVLAQFGST